MPDGKHTAFDAGSRLADHVADGSAASILHAPSTRTRETAQELARGLASALRARNRTAVRVLPPRAESAIRNFHFIIDGASYPPTDRMHASLPASAEQNQFLIGFWQAELDPIAYWLEHPSENAETPAAVARRLSAFFFSLLAASPAELYILVTHSGPMRAFLREVLGVDPGEPGFCEMFLIDTDGVHYRGHCERMRTPAS